MNSTTMTGNFSLTHLNQACLIQMPANFTSVEADSFKKIFQKFCRQDSLFLRWNFWGFRQNSSAMKKIILDFGETIHIDSNGLVGLCQIVQIAKNTKFDLTFCRFSPQVKMVLSLAGLDKILALDNEVNAIVSSEDAISSSTNYPVVMSKKELLLDIGNRIIGLGLMAILFVPIAVTNKLNKNEFLPSL